MDTRSSRRTASRCRSSASRCASARSRGRTSSTSSTRCSTRRATATRSTATRRRRELELLELEPLRPGVREFLDDAREPRAPRRASSRAARARWIDIEPRAARARSTAGRRSSAPTATRPAASRARRSTSRRSSCSASQPHEAIAIEDSPNGIAAARAAGIFCVALPERRHERARSLAGGSRRRVARGRPARRPARARWLTPPTSPSCCARRGSCVVAHRRGRLDRERHPRLPLADRHLGAVRPDGVRDDRGVRERPGEGLELLRAPLPRADRGRAERRAPRARGARAARGRLERDHAEHRPAARARRQPRRDRGARLDPRVRLPRRAAARYAHGRGAADARGGRGAALHVVRTASSSRASSCSASCSTPTSIERAFQLAREARLLLVVGSTLEVQPVAGLTVGDGHRRRRRRDRQPRPDGVRPPREAEGRREAPERCSGRSSAAAGCLGRRALDGALVRAPARTPSRPSARPRTGCPRAAAARGRPQPVCR